MREIQEVIADSEYRVGTFYHAKGSNPAAANRLKALTDQYPLFSNADDALWQLGDAYSKMGPRFRDKSGAAYARIVKEYPLSAFADQARKKLVSMEMPLPEADPVAYARMKYELENRTKAGMISHLWGVFSKSPDTRTAAKSGQPAMTGLRPSIPASVPPPPSGTGTGISADVTASTVSPSDSSALDTQPDARLNPPKPEGAKTADAPPEVLPSNRQLTPKQLKQIEKQSKKINKQ
jgi:outer membrane protein assembly factor BamD